MIKIMDLPRSQKKISKRLICCLLRPKIQRKMSNLSLHRDGSNQKIKDSLYNETLKMQLEKF